ncbi:MAG: hypothetical protein EB078_12610, partial [Proteobacteria bacterium]|nr:hypothetical protein [Pseudomonadota bacterium]
VINFDMGVVNLKMFLGKTLSTVQPEIAGVRVQNSHFNIPFSMPKVGQTGTFVHMPDKSHALATVPVTIKMIVEEMGTCTMRALDMQGVEIKITMTSIDLNRIAGNREVGYLLPKNKFRWVAMEGFDEVTNSPVDYAVKTAGFKKTANPVKLIYTGHGQYSMKGVDKYAEAMNWDKTNLEEYQAKFLLASLGLSQEKIAACMCKAKSCTQCTMHNLKTPPLKDEKIAAALPLARQMAKIAKDLRVNLIKEASFVENTQTVDALLSLNFVNPENVSKMVEKLPSLKSAISNLASLLVASRLGIQEIPEQSVSAAMMKLVDVVNGLEALRATQGQ